MKNILFLTLVALAFQATNAQDVMASISGRVVSEDGKVITDSYVFLQDTSHYVQTNNQGEYSIQIPAGNYKVVCVSIGFVQKTIDISVKEKQKIILDFVMIPDKNMTLEEVRLKGKSKVQKVRETAYNVVALEAKGLYNTTADLSSLLDKASGVKIRATGGVGSNMAISLNGFTGKHVKVFIDGVPMSGLGSAFQINNIALNIADRIEVYKGVVPIELGSDALGGAINIITKQNSNTYLDASYSYGSFNTHKSNINLGYTANSGFTTQLNVFQNYSDNSYKVKTNLLNLETNSYSKEEYWFRRFHDRYRNETAIAKIGILNKSWTDKLLFGVTIGQEHADIQNANLMKIVYGGKKRESSSVIPSFEYSKTNMFTQGLKLSVMANYSQVRNKNIDTLARQYNWLGNFRNKTSKGEGQYSLGKFENNNATIISNISYKINQKHHFALNNTFSAFERKFSDAVANSETSSEADNFKRANDKNVLGASYTVKPYNQWNTSLFGKYYSVNVTGPVDISNTSTPKYVERSRSFNSSGYGLATSFLVIKNLLLKASFEKAYRLPTTNELFGDQVLEKGDVSLKAEHSQNINFNISYNYAFNKNHSLYADVGLIYRNIQDYIRRQIEQRYGGAFYTNHGHVRNAGVDLETRYYYKENFSVGVNLTYQNIRNMERYSATGQEVIYYKDRMPNVPYFFGNLDANYTIEKLWSEKNSLSIGYASQYIHEFFRQWESEGAANSKKIIPTQWSHDLSFTYSIKNGTYNISLETKNITNELLFDNYSLQKPGRSFAVKLRYFFNKNSNN